MQLIVLFAGESLPSKNVNNLPTNRNRGDDMAEKLRKVCTHIFLKPSCSDYFIQFINLQFNKLCKRYGSSVIQSRSFGRKPEGDRKETRWKPEGKPGR